jgi:hypothetical protein
MQKYYAGMFPQYPLGRLEDGHPIYSAYFKTGRGLSGVSNGVRLLAVHSAEELSLPWQVNDTRDRADAFRLAANVYFHVTDRGSLRQRGTSPWPTARAFEPLGRIRLAVVKHGGNWNPEPLAWQRLAILAGNLHRISVEVCGPADPRDLEAARWPAAALTGAGPLELSEPQRAGLKKYLADGGTLVVDAAGGNAAFAGSAEKLLADLLPDAKAGPLPANHAVYTGRGLGPPGAGDLAIAKVAYRRSLRPGVGAPDRPRLISYVQNGRIKAILSREDITCGLVGYPCSGLEGYEPRSAFELMRNILLYANGKGPADPAGYRAKTGRPFLGTAF